MWTFAQQLICDLFGLLAVIWKNFVLNNAPVFCNTNVINTDHLFVSIGILWISVADGQFANEMVHLTIVPTIIAPNMMRRRAFAPMETSKCKQQTSFFFFYYVSNFAMAIAVSGVEDRKIIINLEIRALFVMHTFNCAIYVYMGELKWA